MFNDGVDCVYFYSYFLSLHFCKSVMISFRNDYIYSSSFILRSGTLTVLNSGKQHFVSAVHSAELNSFLHSTELVGMHQVSK